MGLILHWLRGGGLKTMKFYKYGKDAEGLPCIELDDGTLITEPEILLALIKALVKKGVVTQGNIKTEL